MTAGPQKLESGPDMQSVALPQPLTCRGMSRTLRVDMKSGISGASSSPRVSPARIISRTVRRGHCVLRVTQLCFMTRGMVSLAAGSCSHARVRSQAGMTLPH